MLTSYCSSYQSVAALIALQLALHVCHQRSVPARGKQQTNPDETISTHLLLPVGFYFSAFVVILGVGYTMHQLHRER